MLEKREAACRVAALRIYAYILREARPMNAVSSKTFKSGNSVAVRLPKALGIAADVEVVIERNGNALTIRPKVDPEAEKARLAALLADLRAIGAPPDGPQEREPFEFPDRPGL